MIVGFKNSVLLFFRHDIVRDLYLNLLYLQRKGKNSPKSLFLPKTHTNLCNSSPMFIGHKNKIFTPVKLKSLSVFKRHTGFLFSKLRGCFKLRVSSRYRFCQLQLKITKPAKNFSITFYFKRFGIQN